MDKYIVLNVDGFREQAQGAQVELSPEDANAWIEEGALLQPVIEAIPTPEGQYSGSSNGLDGLL